MVNVYKENLYYLNKGNIGNKVMFRSIVKGQFAKFIPFPSLNPNRLILVQLISHLKLMSSTVLPSVVAVRSLGTRGSGGWPLGWAEVGEGGRLLGGIRSRRRCS